MIATSVPQVLMPSNTENVPRGYRGVPRVLQAQGAPQGPRGQRDPRGNQVQLDLWVDPESPEI